MWSGRTKRAHCPGASPGAGRSVREVEAHPTAARERAENARRVLETRFAPGPWLDRYEAVYTELVNRS